MFASFALRSIRTFTTCAGRDIWLRVGYFRPYRLRQTHGKQVSLLTSCAAGGEEWKGAGTRRFHQHHSLLLTLQNRKFTSGFDDRTSFRATGLRRTLQNRNFTSVFDDRISFRAKGLRRTLQTRNFTPVVNFSL